MNRKSAISAIDKAGALLVFPMDNRPEPASIWSHFHPRKKMLWEWDEGGDDTVAQLWHLRGELSTTRKVIYTKWYRGRATYFSLPLFSSMLRVLNSSPSHPELLSGDARRILGVLESESPVSTKELKRMSDLRGRANERAYEKAMQELWSRLLIVAYGEVDDGAFPSLAVGSTRVLFEELWNASFAMTAAQAERTIVSVLSTENFFYRHFVKLRLTGTPRVPLKKRTSRRGVVPSIVRFEDLR